MKELKTRVMKKLLVEGIRKAKKQRPASDGHFINLIYRTKKNGWHYQVEYITDSRCYEHPTVIVYAFKPPLNWSARSADFYLKQSIPRRNGRHRS